MSSTFLAFQSPTVASASGVKPKRKRAGSVEAEEATTKHLRIIPPQYDNSTGFPPDLVPDMTTSTTASESDNMMDHDMDFDMDEPLDTPGLHDTSSYCYAEGGSGGFGFGPGAEEDEMESEEGSPKGGYAQLGFFPNGITTGQGQFTQSAPINPVNPGWGASAGLIQPTSGVALGPEASAVERVRNAHGPQCTSIPQLRMSDYPDANGARSLWSVCQDCGACERAS